MDSIGRWALAAMAAVAVLGWSVAFTTLANAHDPSQPHSEWYKNQKINPEARPRLNVPFTSCCDESDHFKTRFRVLNDGSKYGTETYEYLAGEKWKVISPDIIKRAPTPDGQPVLFIHKTTGKELCFIIDEGGT